MEHQRIQGRVFLWTLQRKQAMLAPLYWTLVSRSMREYILAVCVLVRFVTLTQTYIYLGRGKQMAWEHVYGGILLMANL